MLKVIKRIPVKLNAQYFEGDFELVITKYLNNRPAIFIESVEGAKMGVLSVNLPEESLEQDEIFIKDWSENEGLLDSLVQSGILIDTGKRHPVGFVEAAICKLVDS